MIKFFSKAILKLFGWKLEVTLPKEKKFILIGAPHTSNWDFPLAMLVFGTIKFKINWLAKIQIFRGPLHYLFTAMGGIPIDRKKTTGFIQQISEKFDQKEQMVLTIAPEGTRSKTNVWKSGFYHIALAANVPICFGYIDYGRRTLGFNQILYPSGDIKEDMKVIAQFYENIKGKHPQNQGPVRLRENQQ